MLLGRDTLGRVLIVEDDALLGLALSESLRDAGAEDVICCATTAEAMEALSSMRPQVLILDVGLADRSDGWGLAELAMQLAHRPPMIIFSTGSPELIPQHVADLGVVMEKPYAPQELVRVVRRSLGDASLLARIRRRLSNSES